MSDANVRERSGRGRWGRRPAPPGGALVLGLGIVLVLALGWAAFRLGTPPEPDPVRATLSAAAALAGSDTAGFARVTGPRAFRFPEDHGAHPEYRTEWWYLTGHLAALEGDRAFGFQLTFFRSALEAAAPESASAWATNQLWMAHFALTDVAGQRHLHGERLARGAAGLAGASAEPFRVWLEDWSLAREAGAPPVAGSGSAFPMRLRAGLEGGALELRVDEGKPPVLQGEQGYSRKGPAPGNASYYLSWTRMPLSGTVTLDGERIAVAGQGWMDREWSTSALDPVHEGWDWFSLQLGDGRELMFFELRRRDGAPEPLNHGVVVDPDGETRPLGADDVRIEVTEEWTSPLDGTRYPGGWILRIPEEDATLTLVPRVANQEMNVTFRYWEGALEVAGSWGGEPVEGVGYAELTGYADEGGRTARDAAGPAASPPS
jgi:predicted secreted hydrolase